MIHTHKLELPLSRTNFHGPRGVRAIEVLLYSLISKNTVRALISCFSLHFTFQLLLSQTTDTWKYIFWDKKIYFEI